MSDVSTADAPATPAAPVNVPITKAKTTIAVNIDDIPADVWNEVVFQGLKVVLNRGMSKITAKDTKNEEEMKSLALEAGQKNLADMYEGKTKITGQKKQKSGVGREVMTEARKIAKALVKDAIKQAGMKPSHVPPKQITEAANLLLDGDQGPSIIAQAKENIEKRSKVNIGDLNIKSVIHEDAKLVAKAKARNKPAEGQLSAKQAGTVKGKAKGEAATAH